jgi:hypothetical protein
VEHPGFVDLAAYLDGELLDDQREMVAEHLKSCASCRVATLHSGEHVPTPEAEVDLEGASIPEQLRAHLQEVPPEPAAGQIWRLRWNEVTALSVVLRVHEEEVTVAPVSVDSWLADEYAVYVSAEWSPIGVALAIWVSLVGTVPLCVLDRYLGDVDVLDQLPSVRDAFRKGIPAPSHIPVGSPILSAFDERSQYRRQLTATFSALADVEWHDPTFGHGDGDLGATLDGLEAEEIGSCLGLGPPDVFVLLRGETPLTAEQADKLAALSGTSAEDLLRATPPVPSELVRELDHPANRSLIEVYAIRNDWSPTQVRFEARNALLGLATRFAGDPKAPIDWRRVLRDWLDA